MFPETNHQWYRFLLCGARDQKQHSDGYCSWISETAKQIFEVVI